MRSSELSVHCYYPTTGAIRYSQIWYHRSGIIMNRTNDGMIFNAKIYCNNSIVQKVRGRAQTQQIHLFFSHIILAAIFLLIPILQEDEFVGAVCPLLISDHQRNKIWYHKSGIIMNKINDG